MKYQKLFEPVQIGKCRIENRFAMCAMGPVDLGDDDGGFNQRGIDYYVERAKGGTGLIITGATHVANDVEIHEYPSMPCATLNPRVFIRSGKELTERVPDEYRQLLPAPARLPPFCSFDTWCITRVARPRMFVT